jgi:hypothetical protein
MEERQPALLALVAEGFIMRLGFGIIIFALPLYAIEMGLSLAETGALLAVTGMGRSAVPRPKSCRPDSASACNDVRERGRAVRTIRPTVGRRRSAKGERKRVHA